MTQSLPVTHWPERHGSRNLKVSLAEPLTVCEPGPGTIRIQPHCYGSKAAIFTCRHLYSFPPFIPGQWFVFLSKWPLLFYDTSQPRTHKLLVSSAPPRETLPSSGGQAWGQEGSKAPGSHPIAATVSCGPKRRPSVSSKMDPGLLRAWLGLHRWRGASPKGASHAHHPPSSAQQAFGHRVLLTGGQSWAR